MSRCSGGGWRVPLLASVVLLLVRVDLRTSVEEALVFKDVGPRRHDASTVEIDEIGGRKDPGSQRRESNRSLAPVGDYVRDVITRKPRIMHPVAPEETDKLVSDVVRRTLPGADVEAMLLCFSLIRAADRVQQDFEVNVQRPQGMTWAGFRTLFALGTLGPLIPLELARLNSVSQASISSVLKTLTRSKLVKTKPSVDDARSVTISLTRLGERRFEELFRLNNARESQWSNVLSSGERAILIGLLTKLRDFQVPPTPRVTESVPT